MVVFTMGKKTMTDFTLELAEDAQSRIRALDLTSFIVEAPAGAGKTELLTQRFLKLLQVVDEPEEIIAITFTNKAAAEMRTRILDSLMNAAAGIVPTQPHKVKTYELSLAAIAKSTENEWALLDNPARLRIFTIDGLCAYLARQMPLMSSFGSQPNIAEDPNVYYAQAVDKTLEMIDDDDLNAVVIDALRYLDNDTSQLKKLLTRMLAQRDQWLHHAQQTVSTEALQDTLSFVVSEELRAISQVINAPIQHALMPLAQYAASNLSCECPVALLNEWDEYLPTEPNSIVLWQAIADLLLTGSNKLRKTVTVKDGFPATGKDQKQAFLALLNNLREDPRIEATLQRIRVLPSMANHEASWEMIATLSQLLNIAAAQLWLVFSYAREVDFVEVSQRAISALAGEHDAPTDLALRLDYQVKHMLVDEFQDTSPSQISLLEKLTQGWQAEDGRTLFLVGDPMQSIYRFRKANVGLFLNAAQQGIGDVALESLRLYRNNRSCPAVVNWINSTFNNIFPAVDNTAKGAITYRPFIATRSGQDNEGVDIHPIIKTSDESNDTAKAREAQAVIDIIVKERAQNPEVKIAILVRAKSHLQGIVSELRRHHPDIPFQAVEIQSLANRQIVQDLLSLTRALYHRADRVNWLATLRAPWCGLTLDDLHALAGADHYSTIWSLMQRDDLALSAEGQKRLTHVRDIFAEAFASKGRVNTSRWVRGVWLMLGGANCLWAESDVVDVQAFFDCIAKLDRANQFSLAKMEAEITKLFAAPDAKGEALQMMSIHKSKGLEFDVVILPGLGNSTGGNDDKPIVLWEEVALAGAGDSIQQTVSLLAAPIVPKGLKQKDVSPYDYLNALEKERDSNEDARILYVAATRTERKLHLVGIASQNQKEEINATKNTYLGLLWSVASATYATHDLSAVMENDSVEEPISITAFVPKLFRLVDPHIPKTLSVDTTKVKVNHQQQLNQTNHSEGDAGSIERSVGILTHKYLELISQQDLAQWHDAKVDGLKMPMTRWFEKEGFKASVAEEAATKVQTLLRTTLQSADGQWVLKQHDGASAEMAMTQLRDLEAKDFIVDRTFIAQNGTEKTRWIIDYKSMPLPPDMTDEALKATAETNEYAEQLAGYATLFYDEKLPIKKAILFVSIGRLQVVD
jgi:ATP-dependent exoDNAse (exonuclease V) beta subunit